ncbi:hypothetical protein J2I47_24235 [Fibrella sp. HMF5335]|uniref:Outer membrane protein beta-barrel domain-containing protein n=1 Tax=Fibrella rubiginis TaxID=2817060 RepID=A0A939GNG8_9BACT|nr:hypothetical protein [Fibrella rubiginis]MBO0939678.1 hypothetical protein [Fibrella rubiginis]
MHRLIRLMAGLTFLYAGTTATHAQQGDTLRRNQATDRYAPRERIFNLGKGGFADTVNRASFKSQYPNLTELQDCDTTLQTFALARRISPWRIGFYAGPAFAYCGSWANTFGPTKRDNSLYNGTGINTTFSADYFFTKPEKKFKLGLSAALGYQNFYTRDDWKTDFLAIANTRGIQSDRVTLRNKPQEDFFLTVGPILSWEIGRRKNPFRTATFIEAAARGGLYRTESAFNGASVPSAGTTAEQIVRIVEPSNRLLHFGANASVGVFFPIGNSWLLGPQVQGYYTDLNYLIIDGGQTNLPNNLFEFTRKHGGFSAGLGVRRTFIQKRLIPKAPTFCPTCDSIPRLTLNFRNAPLNGLTLAADSIPDNVTAPTISWRSTTINPKNETFTARLYFRPDSVGTQATGDQIIAQVVDTKDTTLAFPTQYLQNGKPTRGFYYVTVHNHQTAPCGDCMSEVATTSFAILGSQRSPLDTVGKPCEFRHRLERLEVYYRNPYTREVANICYCNGQVTSVGDTTTRLRYRTLNRRLATQPFEFDTTALILNIRELPGDLARTLQQEKSQIESGKAIRFKGRRVRPQVQYFRAVFSVTQLPCNGQPERSVGSFNTVISDNTYSITDLKPLNADQYQKLITPPAPRKKARRSGNSGRRDMSFGIDEVNK